MDILTLLLLFFVIIVFVLILVLLQLRKKFQLTKRFVSIIVPTYNDGSSLAKTVKSISQSFEKGYFELIIINDGSKDDTHEKIMKLKNRFKFKYVNNTKNLGKCASINKAFEYTKGEIVFIIDSDMIVNKKAISGMLGHLEAADVAAVSCKYHPIEKGLFAELQAIDYDNLGFLIAATSAVTAIAMWGGCMAVKREPFKEVGMITKNAMTDDMDLALKLGIAGWKVKESSEIVHTHVPLDYYTWMKQKIRWNASGLELMLRYKEFFFRQPIILLFFVLGIVMFTLGLYFLPGTDGIFYGFYYFFKDLLYLEILALVLTILALVLFYFTAAFILYPLMSIPFVLIDYLTKKGFRKKLLYLIPYIIIYTPIGSILNIYAYFKGIYKHLTIKKDDREW